MQRIDDLLRGGTTLSFEFFPPRTPDALQAFRVAFDDLATLAPNFTSMTYGALGNTRAETEALVAEGEDGSVSRFTYRALRLEVGRLAGRLRSLGIRPGDRVGIYMPMAAEVVIGLFACLQIGAVAVPCISR